MSLPAGSRLGPYEVLAPVGVGGMGEVYRARDTRLDRTVALKVLPSEVSSNPERRARFEREARAVSQLNHPHICTLHDVGQHDGADYIVMELLGGETLLERLRKGSLPLDQALRFGIEIADALDAAHRHGIVHRDLKPGNVMLTKAGAKLLDFGLAKRSDGRGASADSQVSVLPTSEKPLTSEGTLLGTFQYMAPEQVEGKEADARSDIWALGAVLYEMLTGQRAFQGKSQASLIAAILEREPPPVSSVRPMSPPALDRLVRTCLAKDPEDRWQSAHDVRAELQWIAQGAGPMPPIQSQRANAFLWLSVALAAGVAIGGAAVRVLGSRPAPRPPLLLSILPPEGGTIGHWVALSPDGRHVAFDVTREGTRQLWLRALDEPDPRPLNGTDDAEGPFWSPDSRSLAFFSHGKLKRLDLDGSTPRSLADAAVPRGGTWSKEGQILFGLYSGTPLLRVQASGGAVNEATVLGDGHSGHRWPSFLPDGRRFLFMVWSTDIAKRGIYAGSLDSREVRLIQNGTWRATFAAGRLFFAVGETLRARLFDPERLELSAEPLRLVNRVFRDLDMWGQSSFSVADDGAVAYRSGVTEQHLTWYDRAGRPTAVGVSDARVLSLEPSPDRGTVAYSSSSSDQDSDKNSIWLLDLQRKTTSRVSTGSWNATSALWSPDGSSLLYRSDREEGSLVVRKSLMGGGQEEVLLKDSNWVGLTDWSRDGRFVLVTRPDPQNRLDLWVLPLFDDRQPRPFLVTPFDETGAQFSPDGAWVAYDSDESGRSEVFIRRFPRSEEKWQVSTQGGRRPRWREDGREIFFIDAAGRLVAAAMSLAGKPIIGAPTVLFSTGLPDITGSTARNAPYYPFDKGQRFLVARRLEEGGGSISVLVGGDASGPR